MPNSPVTNNPGEAEAVAKWEAYAKLAEENKTLRLELSEALEVLRELHDHQNGCPMPKYEKGWNRAMSNAIALLIKHHK